jgi:hypothetical protein
MVSTDAALPKPGLPCALQNADPSEKTRPNGYVEA